MKFLESLLCISMLMCESSCSLGDLPRLDDRVVAEDFTRHHDSTFIKKSSTIIVCKPERVRFSTWHKRAEQMPTKISLQLVEIVCHPEATLKGEALSAKVVFYYYRLDTQYQPELVVNFLPKFKANLGERYIFFLINDQGKLRATGDVFDYMMRVYTGPVEPTLLAGQNLETKLLTVIAEPHSGYSTTTVCSNLSGIAEESFDVNPHIGFRELFGKFLTSADSGLRVCAEEYLKIHP